MKNVKRLNLLLAAYYIIIIIMIPLIFNPIYSSLATDTLTKNTLWPDLLLLIKTLIDIIFYALSLSVIIYSAFLTKGRSNRPILFIAAAGIGIKLLIPLIFDIVGGSSEVSMLIISSIILFAIEFSQVLILYFLSRKKIRSYLENTKEERNASATLKVEYKEKKILPFTSVFDKKNPLMWSSVLASLLIVVPRIIGRLISDILLPWIMSMLTFSHFNFYFQQSFSDTMWIIVSYATDIFSIAVAYFIITYALTFYFEHKSKATK